MGASKMFYFLEWYLTSEWPKTLRIDHFFWWTLVTSAAAQLLLSGNQSWYALLWRPEVLSSRNPWTAHITQEQTQQVQGQRLAPDLLSHSSSQSQKYKVPPLPRRNWAFFWPWLTPMRLKKTYFVCTLHKSCSSVAWKVQKDKQVLSRLSFFILLLIKFSQIKVLMTFVIKTALHWP